MSLLTLYWRIAIFRASPADAPNSTAVLLLVAPIWAAATSLMVLGNPLAELANSLLIMQFAVMGFVLLGIYGLLAFKNKTARWQQTVQSFLGVDALFSVLQFGVGLLIAAVEPLALIGMLVTGWQLGALAFILRNALEVGPALSFALLFILMLAGALVAFLFMPELSQHILEEMQKQAALQGAA